MYKKNLKRMLLVVMLVLLAGLLVACGSKQTTEEIKTEEPAQTEQAAEQAQPAEQPKEEPKQEQPVEEPKAEEPVQITFDPAKTAQLTASCKGCHGQNLEGLKGDGPQLTNVGSRLSADEIRNILTNGKDEMPGGLVKGDDLEYLVQWLAEQKGEAKAEQPAEQPKEEPKQEAAPAPAPKPAEQPKEEPKQEAAPAPKPAEQPKEEAAPAPKPAEQPKEEAAPAPEPTPAPAPAPQPAAYDPSKILNTCKACHGFDLKGVEAMDGMPAVPGLLDIGSRYSEAQIKNILVNGKGEMPGGMVPAAEVDQLAKWLSQQK
ncbi:c-type cytochrome [Microaerobacter geothermalis]|uniref:cytochrome c n=1 Tax=Microaerobacter geothermalis TaxID=674972 RepID=UPI001F1C79AD|nr:cytochrome c [Microaerobacter geothermalis]MCF6093392.1 c-type cytochrome [Microaerobacter geothermalis]